MGDQFALKNNQIFVLAEAAGGVYNSDQLRILCEVADNESAFLKITEDQRIGFMIDPGKLPDVQSHVRKSGLLLRSYKASGVPSPRACLGELCTFSHQPSLGDALELTTHLLKSFPAPKRYSSIGINGCQKACLGSSTEDIHVVAEESGYKISIGGKGSEIPQQAQFILENVSRTDLPTVIEKILAVFYQESQDDERMCDVIDRIGLTPFLNAMPEHLGAHTQDSSGIGNSDDITADRDSMESARAHKETDDSLDDLLESSSNEFADADLSHSSVERIDGSDSSAAAQDILQTDELTAGDTEFADDATSAGEGEGIADDLADELLEVAGSDLEEGSLEDVERVRDAIRTELSMTPNNEQSIQAQPTDMLDELTASDDAFDEIESSDEGTSADEFEDNIDFSEPSAIETANDLLGSDEDGLDSVASETAASIEHQTPRNATASKPAWTDAPAQLDPRSARPQAQPSRAAGRLSIRFDGDQLAVELPSGLSFDLPFSSVSEGGTLALSLPDGELQIERHGQMLAVRLGMLNLKIPIPDSVDLQAA